MPYEIDWYIENEVAFIRYLGEITADELRDCLQQTRIFVEQSSRKMVHTITDVGGMTKPVSPLDALRVFRDVGLSANSGWQLIIHEQSTIIKMGIAFGTSVMKARTKAFDTMDDAKAFLNVIDPGLSWDKANVSALLSNS